MTIKFVSISDFKNFVRTINYQTNFDGLDENGEAKYVDRIQPTLTLQGRVKIHGTNAAFRFLPDNTVAYQSRERDLTLQSDNAGFCAWAMQQNITDLIRDIVKHEIKPNKHCIVYGEWCGGNIQAGVAVNGLKKMFVIFGVMSIENYNQENEIRTWVDMQYLDDTMDLELLNSNNIYTIAQFGNFNITVDFNRPHDYVNQIVKMVEEVEAECPVGKYFGVSGIGEGIVFSVCYGKQQHWFKAKGEKHSVSKVRKIAEVDSVAINNVKEFVASAVQEGRLKQGFAYFKENNIEAIPENLGQYIKWVVGDVFKEENEAIVENQLDAKMIAKGVSNVARKYFFEHYK